MGPENMVHALAFGKVPIYYFEISAIAAIFHDGRNTSFDAWNITPVTEISSFQFALLKVYSIPDIIFVK